MNKQLTSFFVISTAVLLIATACFAFDSKPEKPFMAERVADEILVKFVNSTEIVVMKIAQTDDIDKIIKELTENPEIEYAESNFLYQASIIPSDTYYKNQWYLQKIKATEAWNDTRLSPNVIIAVIDSGVQINHPDLKSNIWKNYSEIPENGIDDDRNGFIDDYNGWDFVNNTYDPSPKFESGYTESGILHGTIIAGIVAGSGNNATGITGVTWQAQIMSLKVLNDRGEGNTSTVVKAIDYAIANGVDIINLSFVGFGYSNSLNSAIERAHNAGMLIVAAGGNEQDQGDGYQLDHTPMYPVCYDGPSGENWVIGVAATDTLDQKASFSSYGFKCIDIAAPGVSIFSTSVYSPTNHIGNKSFNTYYDGYWSGTSVAVPMVTGALALVQAANPQLNGQEIADIVFKTVDNLNKLNPNYLNMLGAGRLNIKQAISTVTNELKNTTYKFLIAPQSNHISQTRIVNTDGVLEKEFNSYGENFTGGVNLATGDVNGDGIEEIITGAGETGGPHVRIFNQNGDLLGQFFAYDKTFRGGVRIACSDVDGDGKAEIITGPGQGYQPLVRIFNWTGDVQKQFYAYNKNFRGGVYLAAGDIDGDGQNEIVTGAGETGGPQVRIFDSMGEVQGQFFAYDQNFRGGVRVAIADLDGGINGNKSEIITAPGKSGGPHIRIFDNHSKVLGQFFAYDKNFRGGVNITAGDMDNDGLAEIVTGAGETGGPHVRVFEINSKLINSFYAFDTDFTGGVNIAIIKQ